MAADDAHQVLAQAKLGAPMRLTEVHVRNNCGANHALLSLRTVQAQRAHVLDARGCSSVLASSRGLRLAHEEQKE